MALLKEVKNIWPIKRCELKKFLLIVSLMFCILFIQNILRSTKDGIVNTLIGTEVVGFLKTFAVLPASLIFTLVYIKFINRVRHSHIFYAVIVFFLLFIFLFSFVIFPHYRFFHLDTEIQNKLVLRFPHIKWIILMISNWSFSLFYIISELWPNIVFGLLVWQLINMITGVEQSKRFYPLFSLISETGLFFSGVLLSNLHDFSFFVQNKIFTNSDIEVIFLKTITLIVIFFGMISIALFYFIGMKFLKDEQSSEKVYAYHKIPFKEAFNIFISSRYIRNITFILICYGVAINLIETPWKSEIRSVYKTPSQYTSFVGTYLKYTGILTIFFAIVGSYLVRLIGWINAALIPPFVMVTTGIIFFILYAFPEATMYFSSIFSVQNPVMIVVFVGALQNISVKATKYTLFDSTKEMAYVPLDPNLKLKGKAIADILGTKLGKSISSFIQATIFVIFPGAVYSSISSFLMICFVLVSFLWIYFVTQVNKEYEKLCQQKA